MVLINCRGQVAFLYPRLFSQPDDVIAGQASGNASAIKDQFRRCDDFFSVIASVRGSYYCAVRPGQVFFSKLYGV